MDSLFDTEESQGFDRDRLRDRLRELAVRRVFVGGSSWKYEGWLGQIYSRSRYLVRGRFSKKQFEDNCLREYATVFPTVCGDFAFYQFPTEQFWAKLFHQTPESFRWGLKVPEQITVERWPVHPRYGALAGLENPAFLDYALLDQSFLKPLTPWKDRVGVLIFEFGTSHQKTPKDAARFIEKLDRFLDRLPGGWRYAVEIRTSEFLCDSYFDCLRAHDVTHVYNAWARMPEIGEQLLMAKSRTSDLIVARALLRKGRPYEEAVQAFSPYTHVQDINLPVRRSLRDLIGAALVDGTPAFLFVNNRLEGNSPGTIIAITD